jgi:DMSO/TMAO reductase YedYZ molybdopterin-dependent catalytic subunit
MFAGLMMFAASRVAAADQAISPSAAANQHLVVSFGGKVKHPLQLNLDALQKLPAEQVKVTYQAGRGVEEASFTGVPLWTLLGEAGGIDDPAKRAELHHIMRITGWDGYLVVISTGEIAPDFGGKPALLAYRRNDEAPAETGFRLVMPGDKHGGRYVRDVVSIEVE